MIIMICTLMWLFSRSYNRPQPELANPCGKVADGDLIWRYLTLPHCQRLEIAKKSGQSLESVCLFSNLLCFLFLKLPDIYSMIYWIEQILLIPS